MDFRIKASAFSATAPCEQRRFFMSGTGRESMETKKFPNTIDKTEKIKYSKYTPHRGCSGKRGETCDSKI